MILSPEAHAFCVPPLLAQVGRLDDEREALLLRADELRRQLEANAALDVAERRQIAGQLAEAEARLAPGAGAAALDGRGGAAGPQAAATAGQGSARVRRQMPR